MTELPFKNVSSSLTTTVDNRQRKIVEVSKAPSCWHQQIAREILDLLPGTYYRRYDSHGNPDDRATGAAYVIAIKLTGSPFVKVHLRFNAEPGFTGAEEHFATLSKDDPMYAITREAAAGRVQEVLNKFLVVVNKTWNKRFNIEITDPACGVKVMPIIYDVIHSQDGPHYTIKAYKTFKRERVDRLYVHLSQKSLDTTHVHEFGHCIGLPDEYSHSDEHAEMIRYKKPDGTLDQPIIGILEGTKTPHSNELMIRGTPKFHERHAWNIAIETQRILSSETGRQIKCRILLA